MTGMLTTRNCEVHSLAIRWCMVTPSALASLARWGGRSPPGHRAKKIAVHQHSGVHAPCTVPQRRNTHAAAWHITCDHLGYGLGPMRALTRPGHAWHDAAPMHGRCRVGTFARGAHGVAQRKWNFREGCMLKHVHSRGGSALSSSVPFRTADAPQSTPNSDRRQHKILNA